MNNRIIYHPLTATPFKRNIFYTELSPCKELHSYIRCYWGTEKPFIQVESNGCKQFDAGKTIEETAKLVQHPMEVVRAWYEAYQKEKGSD